MYFSVRSHSHSRIDNRRQLQIFSMPNILRASATCRRFPQIASLIIHTARLSRAGTSTDFPPISGICWRFMKTCRRVKNRAKIVQCELGINDPQLNTHTHTHTHTKGVIQYVPGRNPPSPQVLESSSPPPRVQNTIYRIGGFPIYESRRGRNQSRRIKTRPKNGFNLGHMKHGMNSPVRRREFEADCHWTNNFSDRERANKFGSQFITHGLEWNVLGRKPHFLTNDVDGRLRPVAISLSLGARPHPEESLSGSRPGTVTPLDEGVSRGDRDFGFHTEGNLGKGIKWAVFENRSTTVKTTVLPREGGRAVTKSSAIWDQGLEGTDSGWSNPSGGRLEVLPRAQTEQAKTNSRIIASHGPPPESLFNQKHGATNSWMTSHVGTMTPLNSVRMIKNAWQRVGFDVLRTRPIGDGKIKTSEK